MFTAVFVPSQSGLYDYRVRAPLGGYTDRVYSTRAGAQKAADRLNNAPKSVGPAYAHGA